ncbi:MAG TPA: hypothetical protein PK719_10160 [Bacteroidales bacterium]|nr:hypothetical protein [Bacteroidales bacterium]OQB64120.1 MAG: hypothetical protein BWX96_00894 [Bacteroidetes bacterium ADurb.Bin145]NMD03665.1 hypothetical protein [Bacteroidales bacterium]HOU02426.1 hypothetical protein [Bacteroidales bacterium]HQG64014.1 hypothetical protein [Bacteroidales bacterium]
MKRTVILILLIFIALISLPAQSRQDDMKREVTLYNPYKPSLPEVRKRSSLPDINDTVKMVNDFKYEISAKPFSPVYNISPIKAASLLPDPLPKLYKSFVKFGIGNYMTPLAEISITNERSKRASYGATARHFSTNGRVKLDNDKRVFAGYMDNDVSLFGKKFFRSNLLEGSVDFSQKTRYAYGYDTSIVDYVAKNKDIRLNYNNLGLNTSFASLNLDSTDFSYDFDVNYDIFFAGNDRNQHNLGIAGLMFKSYKGFYMGGGLEFDHYNPSSSVFNKSKYIFAVNPFVNKNTPLWNFRLGLQLLLDKNLKPGADFHLYPDVSFGFNIVPSYVSFFAGLNGRLEKNDPASVIGINPYLAGDTTLFRLQNTNHPLIISAGIKGNNGLGGNYILSASYSIVNNMLFFSNRIYPVIPGPAELGNFFLPLNDDAEVLNVHGEVTGQIGDKISFRGIANWYKYTLTKSDHAWNRPDWDMKISVKYNLRDKIIASADLTSLGKYSLVAYKYDLLLPPAQITFNKPAHFNLNIGAEYRYTKILSVWAKINNISFNRYYEWAYYPTQRFLLMAGFTYSL